MNKEALVQELKTFIPKALSLDDEDISLDSLSDSEPFLTEDLGIDSIDVLELTVALEKKYKVKIGNAETAREIFQNLGTLADFILKNSPLAQ